MYACPWCVWCSLVLLGLPKTSEVCTDRHKLHVLRLWSCQGDVLCCHISHMPARLVIHECSAHSVHVTSPECDYYCALGHGLHTA